MDSREAEIEYCKAHGIDLPFSADSSYSRDRNLWHISHEGLELEDPANEPNFENMLVLGVTPEQAPEKGEYVTMTFEQGVPKTLNGKAMKVSEIITELNALGGKHGIGIVDIVTQKYVTGEVKFKLYKGNIIKAGTTSPYSLYNESLASFTTGDMYDHNDASGFITLFGLPLKVRAMMLAEVEKKNLGE